MWSERVDLDQNEHLCVECHVGNPFTTIYKAKPFGLEIIIIFAFSILKVIRPDWLRHDLQIQILEYILLLRYWNCTLHKSIVNTALLTSWLYTRVNFFFFSHAAKNLALCHPSDVYIDFDWSAEGQG